MFAIGVIMFLLAFAVERITHGEVIPKGTAAIALILMGVSVLVKLWQVMP